MGKYKFIGRIPHPDWRAVWELIRKGKEHSNCRKVCVKARSTRREEGRVLETLLKFLVAGERM